MIDTKQASLALILSGDIFLKDNQPNNAIDCYLKAYEIENIKAWDKSVVLRFYNNLAIAYKRKGDISRAQKLLETGIALEPTHTLFYYNLLGILKAQNDIQNTEKLLLKAISLQIEDIRFHLSLTELYKTTNTPAAALKVAIDCVKKFAQAYDSHLTLGNCYSTLKMYKNAVEAYSNAIRINPSITSAYNNLGVAYKELGEYELSRKAYEKVLEINPNDSAVHNNFGNLLRFCDDFAGAITHIEQSIKLNPSYPDAYSNLGAVYKENKEYSKAEPLYRKALSLNPNHTNANFDLALIELFSGNYDKGWQHYEHRIKMDELRAKIYPYTTPIWRGEDLRGKTLILQNEQGFGDNIMFIRYVPMFLRLGANVILRTRPELVNLFKSIEGIKEVYSEEESIPKHDYYLPLLSSPNRFKTTLESVPKVFPYLSSYQEKSEFSCNPKRFNIGIVWSSSKTNKDFKNKYIGLEHYKELFSLKGTSWYSLQTGEDASEIQTKKLDKNIVDLSGMLNDFSATASIIDKLDLIITTDTAVAHLCGAMNKQAWVLVPTPSDWRWMQEGDRTPWYDSLKLYRQDKRGSWKEPIAKIRDHLIPLITSKAK